MEKRICSKRKRKSKRRRKLKLAIKRPSLRIPGIRELLRQFGMRPIVLYCRVSSKGQDDNQNLEDQKAALLERFKDCTILGCFGDVARGSNMERPEFKKAVDLACQTGAFLVAETTDRFIRHKKHKRTLASDKITEDEVSSFKKIIRGVKIAVVEPNRNKARGLQTIRGKDAKGNPGGRPRKATKTHKKNGKRRCGLKERKKEYLPLIIKMDQQGFTVDQMVVEINQRDDGFQKPARSTVFAWRDEIRGKS